MKESNTMLAQILYISSSYTYIRFDSVCIELSSVLWYFGHYKL